MIKRFLKNRKWNISLNKSSFNYFLGRRSTKTKCLASAVYVIGGHFSIPEKIPQALILMVFLALWYFGRSRVPLLHLLSLLILEFLKFPIILFLFKDFPSPPAGPPPVFISGSLSNATQFYGDDEVFGASDLFFGSDELNLGGIMDFGFADQQKQFEREVVHSGRRWECLCPDFGAMFYFQFKYKFFVIGLIS